MITKKKKPKLDDKNAFAAMSDGEIQRWISEALQRPSDFGYRGDNDEIFITWSLGPMIQHRDSDIRQKSNAKKMVEALEEDPSLADDWEVCSSGHWAVGWVEQLSFRVVDKDGKPSRVARVIKGLLDTIEECGNLDDEDISRMEYEATLGNIEGHYRSGKLKDDIPDDWVIKMFSWFWDNMQTAVEPCDGDGGYPEDRQFEECARALGYWDTSEDEDE